MYFSNGVEPAHWWAKGEGAAMELGPGLLPMMPHRQDMVFLKGLFNQTAHVSTSPHLGRMNVLSGAPVSLDPNDIRVGTSMDQVIASRIGARTALQGNVDPAVLLASPEAVRREVQTALESFGTGAGHVFNLGHGVPQLTPPENVAALIAAPV